MRATFLAAVALAAATAPAVAEPVPPKARKLAERGRELHERGDYNRAIVAFKEAYVLAPSPGLLFNLAQAYRLSGNCDDAAMMYQRFIDTAAPARKERELAQGHLDTVRRCIQKRNLNLPPDPAMASIPMPPPPGPDPLFVDTPTPTPSSSSRGRLARRVGLSLSIGGAAALTAAAFYGFRSYQAAADVEDRYAAGEKWRDLEPIHARGERAEAAAKWLAIGGGVGAAAGVTLFVLGRRAERTPPVTVAPMQGGARVGLSWAF